MPSWLVDSNVLLRAFHSVAPDHATARDALQELHRRGDTLCFNLQVMAEFWAVCTRPGTARGGLGLSPSETESRLAQVEPFLIFLVDIDEVRDRWLTLVKSHGVQGVRVHDARLVAAMLAHDVDAILTFNDHDFRRFEPQISVWHPHSLLART